MSAESMLDRATPEAWAGAWWLSMGCFAAGVAAAVVVTAPVSAVYVTYRAVRRLYEEHRR